MILKNQEAENKTTLIHIFGDWFIFLNIGNKGVISIL